MKYFSFVSPILLYLHLLFLFTLTLICFGSNKIVAVTILGNQTDHLALLKFKESISIDPYRTLESWNSSIHFCSWFGITCSPMHQRVIELNLYGSELHGSLSPYVGNLTFLKILFLRNNSFFGEIPHELGHLLHLQQLFLTNNSFSGEIPTNLTYCSNLTHLYLGHNNLIGKIPIEIRSLKKLQFFDVSENNLTGGIPSFIGNLSSLERFTCAANNIKGDIPQEICRLKNLSFLLLGENKLSGIIPSCLFNISSLTTISIALNNFHGPLPLSMFNTLPNLQVFEIEKNQFSGPITSIINASSIRILALNGNHFVGQVPSLGRLKDIDILNLELNQLGNSSSKDLEFLNSLTNCTKLSVFSIGQNNFGGILPNSIGNLSTVIKKLIFGDNTISGQIPPELGRLVSLILLEMGNNQLEGNIPTTFGKFQNMQWLSLSGNKLSGDIPPFIGNLSQLFHLEIQANMFRGNIPQSIGNCQNLQHLDLSHNKLRGTIPLEVFNLFSLSNLLDLSHNSFSSSLPEKVGMLKNIGRLDVSHNHLSGDIPISIGECTVLEYLSLQGNSFNGTIPPSLAFLKGLQYLDLSINRFSGTIPDVIQNISGLKYLNVSFNMLEGEVPISGVFGNASLVAMIGNKKLCGGIPPMRLPACSVKDREHPKHHKFMFVVIGVISLLLLIVSIFLTIYWMKKRIQKKSFHSPIIDQLDKVSYRDLHQGTNGFSITNLIGSGSFGSVYKGNLVSEDNFVAIKVFNLQKKGARKSFILECNALKNIRHRNLVKIITCCSSSDYKGQEFKALVFDYVKNGSLEQWLHPEISNVENQTSLDLTHRVNIITDVASALHYLHQECEQLIIHCDLKPSNVLLDDDMVAHVSDFGIARLVSSIDGTSNKDTSTIGIKGTVGYAPPEYGMGYEVSTCGDMYSFGILMLEMLTGRRPTNEVFEDGQNLHNLVAVSFPNNLINVLDPGLVPRDAEVEIQDRNRENAIQTVEECLVSLFRIGLNCSMEPPKERMNIVDVTKELSIRKTLFAGVRTYN
ncbi:unnamed protein product [Lathyrus sativus]|nr:unnamed protein product [Lathyrus sativus]